MLYLALEVSGEVSNPVPAAAEPSEGTNQGSRRSCGVPGEDERALWVGGKQ